MRRDQADRLRELVRLTATSPLVTVPRAATIVVSSGRIGEGATTLALHLGRQLARMGQRVVLVDADLDAARLTELLQATPGALGRVLDGERRAVETLTRVDDRIDLLTGGFDRGANSLRGESLRRLSGELSSLGRRADLVLIDAGAGMNPWIDRLWAMSDQTLLVCRCDALSLRAAYQSVKLSGGERLDDRIRLVVNACDDAARVAALGRTMAATCEQFLSLTLRESLGVGRLDAPGEAYKRSVSALAVELRPEDHAALVPASNCEENKAKFLKSALRS